MYADADGRRAGCRRMAARATRHRAARGTRRERRGETLSPQTVHAECATRTCRVYRGMRIPAAKFRHIVAGPEPAEVPAQTEFRRRPVPWIKHSGLDRKSVV